MNYQGLYRPKNPQKYIGDFTKIVYRSSWELCVMKWCDCNSSILNWASEELTIPYKCPSDNKMHRYYVDFYIKFKDQTLLVELKPEYQTKPPKERTRRTSKYLKEVFVYNKNRAKWEAANQVAKAKGWKFEVWTETTMRRMGLKII